ncbi:MAG: glutaconyl-CoA decarboxylase subunit beta [Spirochaetes bacterium GWF1_31_7]|nr:MAG: glutaconyl-CoA decarboxylase subunit beta [Spirochaetes bacterium GWE1_32_154]OHD47991.1 MAG: glutaconyl-CoA decarboxylase subunit beta [Spirochaetes bacterium GWF1_31_7]OHD48082.1 MAG: glutaconyl-CoA decarboxylase subunit beta [Spirochaetes bacterium GWE2_31_10]OHD79962.1 MAG: glutaconyl-CoA decarboxylase subunit beta [Spirochaetes bacterium RIFOXYB1_FULL_32_8]
MKVNKNIFLYCIILSAAIGLMGFISLATSKVKPLQTIQSQTNNTKFELTIPEYITSEAINETAEDDSFDIKKTFHDLIASTGISAFLFEKNTKTETDEYGNTSTVTVFGYQKLIMMIIGLILLYLGVAKGFEPLLLIPIAFGTLLVNVPFAGIGEPPHGFLYIIFNSGIKTEMFPLIIFMGIGALTDFGPLLANPRTALLGAAAQFGIFGSLLGAVVLNLVPGIEFTLKEACAISIIGGADGPTSIYVSSKLAPHLMGSIAVAAYSYMALVPMIQPPIMRLLTTKKERLIKMVQLRVVSKTEKILFPLTLLILCTLLIPSSVPLIGALAFGNFVKETGIVERLSKTLQNELLNIVTIFLGLGVGMKMSANEFMQLSTLGILIIGLVAFSFGTASGVLFAKLMNLISKNPINPLIGAAGVSAVPMSARVANKVGLEDDSSNFLLMHAMGPNVAGVIGSAIAAGVMISIFG